MIKMRMALRERFPLPEWALFFEVCDATGFRGSRYADAVAMNCYPSRGMEIHGVEVKHYRSDWLRELKHPEKSVAVQQFCDRWWIASVPGVVKPEELPVTWGFLEISATTGKLRQVKAAPELEAKPVTRAFVASMLRSAGKIDQAEVDKAVEARTESIEKRANERVEYELNRRRDAAQEMVKRSEEIRKKTGIDLSRYVDDDAVATAIKFALSTGIADKYNGIDSLRRDLRIFADRLDKAFIDAGIPTETKAAS